MTQYLTPGVACEVKIAQQTSNVRYVTPEEIRTMSVTVTSMGDKPFE